MNPDPNTDWVAVISAVGAAIAAVIAAWQGHKHKPTVVLESPKQDENKSEPDVKS